MDLGRFWPDFSHFLAEIMMLFCSMVLVTEVVAELDSNTVILVDFFFSYRKGEQVFAVPCVCLCVTLR